MRKYKNFPTTDPNIFVHITYSPQSDGRVRLTGYPCYTDGSVKVDGTKPARCTAFNEDCISATEQMLINKVMSKLNTVKQIAQKPVSSKPVSDVEATLQKINAQAEPSIYQPNWSKSTQDRAISHYLSSFFPFIISLDEDPIPDSTIDAYLDESITRTMEHGRSSGRILTATNTARSALHQDLVIHKYLCDNYPELGLPTIYYQLKYKEATKHIELYKSLPDHIHYAFTEKLESCVDSEPLYVFHAVLIFDGALRTSESCAVGPDELTDYNEYSVVTVLWQMKDGNRTDELKSPAAYRLTVLSAWGRNMLYRCLDVMQAQGITDNYIYEPSKLSRWIREKLLECGLKEAHFTIASHMQKMEKDELPTDITAYILRRNRASRWRNICGLSADSIDYLLGHVRHAASSKPLDYSLPDMQRDIAAFLERDAYHSDDDTKVVALSGASDQHLVPYQHVRIINDSDLPLQIRITGTANECGTIGQLIVPSASNPTINTHTSQNQDPAKYIIGQLYGGDHNGS